MSDANPPRPSRTRRPRKNPYRVAPKSERRGLLIVNTGDGKGKTTAALGILVRAAGYEMSVGMFQFIKSAETRYGEHIAAAALGVDIVPLGDGFTWLSAEHRRKIARSPSAAGRGSSETIARGHVRRVDPRRDDLLLDVRLARRSTRARDAWVASVVDARRRHGTRRVTRADRSRRSRHRDAPRSPSVPRTGHRRAARNRALACQPERAIGHQSNQSS